jgi:Xaa-Pro aminopeptidase
MIIGEGIDLREFAARREAVMARLSRAVGLVFAGEASGSLSGEWEPEWNFYYLTGIRDEPGASVLLDPGAEDSRRRAILFLKPLNPELEEWDGFRDRVNESLRDRTGFRTVMRTYQLPRWLAGIARKRGRLACLHPFSVYEGPVSPDLAVFRKVLERSVGVSTVDQTNLLCSLRAVKSRAELAVLQQAADATAAGYRAAAAAIRPSANERDVQRALETGFSSAGGTGLGYHPIVGAGLNSCVLHYRSNNQPLEAGDLILIDAAARVGGYTADVTRTFPISGRLSADQREIYELVLRAQEAAIRAARPGAWIHDVDLAARRIIERAGLGDAFMHGIGHQLGLEVHDATPDGPLKVGMVITIEPGVYLQDRRIGVRIEDDILITRQGPRNLTAMIPKAVAEVEAMVGGGRRRRGQVVARSRRAKMTPAAAHAMPATPSKTARSRQGITPSRRMKTGR